jgi:hypothetical protein
MQNCDSWLARARASGAALCLFALGATACSGSDSAKSGGNGDAGNGSMDGPAADVSATDGATMDASAADGSGGGPDAPESDGTTCSITENDAGTCSSVVASGPMITATCSSGEPPQAQGGTVEDGTYVLSAVTHYGTCPPTADMASTTWVICGDHWDVAQLSPVPDAALTPIVRLNFLASIQGTTIDFTLACGNTTGGVTMRGYSSSGGKLTFVYSVNSEVTVSEYVKQ